MILRIDNLTEPTETVSVEHTDVYKVFSVNNVINYEHKDYNSWVVETTNYNSAAATKLYCVIDTIYNDAFCHWVFECAIYLPLFKLLQRKHPLIKLYLKTPRAYKTIFCEHFDIMASDIVYSLDATCNAVCYFPSPISALNDAGLDAMLVRQLDVFWETFRDNMASKKYSVVVMPRQSKENYYGNDRTINFGPICDYAQTQSDSLILHTDRIEKLATQIDVVHASNVLVVADGSAFHVNGMFCYGKNIIVTGPMLSIMQSRSQPKLDHIVKKIIGQNASVQFIENIESAKQELMLQLEGRRA
jgi:hypothetical protein